MCSQAVAPFHTIRFFCFKKQGIQTKHSHDKIKSILTPFHARSHWQLTISPTTAHSSSSGHVITRTKDLGGIVIVQSYDAAHTILNALQTRVPIDPRLVKVATKNNLHFLFPIFHPNFRSKPFRYLLLFFL